MQLCLHFALSLSPLSLHIMLLVELSIEISQERACTGKKTCFSYAYYRNKPIGVELVQEACLRIVKLSSTFVFFLFFFPLKALINFFKKKKKSNESLNFFIGPFCSVWAYFIGMRKQLKGFFFFFFFLRCSKEMDKI